MRYATAATLVTGGMLVAGRLLLQEGGWRGVALAGGIALPLQLVAFATLLATEGRGGGVFGGRAAGGLLRIGGLAGVAVVAVRTPGVGVAAALIGLAGLLFVLLLLESWALRGTGTENRPTERARGE